MTFRPRSSWPIVGIVGVMILGLGITIAEVVVVFHFIKKFW